MSDRKPRVYFLGSGMFAAPILDRLAKSERIQLVAVGTQPDKAAGRKRVLTPTPLAQWADENGILCERIPSVNTEEYLAHIKNLDLDMIVVVSFGQILKEALLNAVPFGCLNVHGSLLPKYRGASPIKSAILNGEPYIGVSFMQMEKGLDSGPVYESFGMPMPPGAGAVSLEKILSAISAEHIEDCIEKIVQGKLTPEPQDSTIATMSKKVHKVDGMVDWNENAVILERKIRAYHKWPTVICRIQANNRVIMVKITKANSIDCDAPDSVPGQIIACTHENMTIKCGRGALILERLLPEGKKEMSVADFLNGHHLALGDILLNGPNAANANNNTGKH